MSRDGCSPQPDAFERIHNFVVRGANNELTERDWEDFERLLRESDDACRLYLEYVEASDLLGSILEATADPAPTSSSPCSPVQPGAVPRLDPGLGVFSSAFHGAIDYCSSGWPMAYLTSAVVCTIGILILASIPVSHPTQFAGSQTATRSVGQNGALANATAKTDQTRSAPAESPSLLIGRITGMVDCKWSDDHFTPAHNRVALGAKYMLASGLMEITYDTGAKVILQGPCTYEVESETGGYLSLGKLTARVEKKVASDQWPVASESKVRGPSLTTNHQPLATSVLSTLDSPLFTIKTPTATVTDLGTEFGVEVANDGVCEVHVIEGQVKTARTSRAGVPSEEVLLSANQAIRLDPSQREFAAIVADSGRFTSIRRKLVGTPRLLWPILHKTLVAWVSLDNLEQQGVGVLSLNNPDFDGLGSTEFDGITFAEIEPKRWMAGSGALRRTEKDQSQNADEIASPNELVQIAIVYDWTQITIYRNGVQYAQYDAGSRQIFKSDMILTMGKRHLYTGPHKMPTLEGRIEEARFYNIALSPKMIASLKPNEPSSIGPVGWWTFEDGTARDVTDHFPLGELCGNAKIADGKLILDGAGSYLLVPPALKRNKLPPADVKAPGEPSREPKEESRIESNRKGGSGV